MFFMQRKNILALIYNCRQANKLNKECFFCLLSCACCTFMSSCISNHSFFLSFFLPSISLNTFAIPQVLQQHSGIITHFITLTVNCC